MLGRSVYFVKRNLVLRCDPATRLVLRCKMDRAILQATELAVDQTPSGCHLADLARQHMSRGRPATNAQVPVSRKTIASMAAIFSKGQRIESFTPGRFFFIWMAVVKTSSARPPKAGDAMADQLAADVVEIGLEDPDGVAGLGRAGRFAHQEPQDVGLLGQIRWPAP